MNKKIYLIFAMIFSVVGAYIPTLLGDRELISGWSILGGLIGGFIGIWLGVIVSKMGN